MEITSIKTYGKEYGIKAEVETRTGRQPKEYIFQEVSEYFDDSNLAYEDNKVVCTWRADDTGTFRGKISKYNIPNRVIEQVESQNYKIVRGYSKTKDGKKFFCAK